MAAREKLFETLYTIPLANARYKSTADAPSREAYKQQLIEMGIEIPLEQNYTYFERAATPEDYEVQQYGLENVGREDYRRQRQNAAIQKNIEILRQQVSSGNLNSKEFLNNYVGDQKQSKSTEKGPRGEETFKQVGPRGEMFSDIASNQGPSSPVKYDENMKQYVPNPGAGRPTNIRYKGFPLAEDEGKPEFDEQKALIAKQTADEYRRQAQTEDPFRSGAFS